MIDLNSCNPSVASTPQEVETGAKKKLSRPVSSPRHVLFLIDRIWSVGAGAEGTVLKLSNSLPKDQYTCSVATFMTGPGVASQFSCPLHVLPIQRTYDWNALKMAIRLSRLIRSERVDIVHTFFPTSDIWGGLIAKLSGCPTLISSRRDTGFLRSRTHRIAYRLLGGMYDQVHMVSNKVRQLQVVEDRLDESRAITVYNGIDLAAVDAADPLLDRSQLRGCNDSGPVITTVANIRQVKGIDVLIRAAASVCRACPSARFVVVGEAHYDSYLEELKALAASLGVENQVRFMGSRKDVFSILKSSDIFCLPSRTEGMSNALIEAMASRLPCVATDVGGNGELITNGKTGFLVPNEDAEAMASALIKLIDNSSLATEIGRSGRQRIEESFTLERMITRYLDLYRQVTENKRIKSTLVSAVTSSRISF